MKVDTCLKLQELRQVIRKQDPNLDALMKSDKIIDKNDPGLKKLLTDIKECDSSMLEDISKDIFQYTRQFYLQGLSQSLANVQSDLKKEVYAFEGYQSNSRSLIHVGLKEKSLFLSKIGKTSNKNMNLNMESYSDKIQKLRIPFITRHF